MSCEGYEVTCSPHVKVVALLTYLTLFLFWVIHALPRSYPLVTQQKGSLRIKTKNEYLAHTALHFQWYYFLKLKIFFKITLAFYLKRKSGTVRGVLSDFAWRGARLPKYIFHIYDYIYFM